MTMENPLTLLGIFAHPDDELSMGGCLAQHAAAGGRSVVACATRGDGVDAKISDPALATPETLGRVRSAELACCCETLGIDAPRFLGLQDGEVERADPEIAIAAVLALLRELRPQVVVTHGPEGGYGHPDHLAVSAFVTRAVERADGDGGPAKLYYTAFPRSIIQLVPGMAERRADIGGRQLAFTGVADEDITTVVEIGDWMARKDAARACHRTQFRLGPDGRPQSFFSTLPEEDRRRLMRRECFVLARTRGSQPERPEDDLFAGLRGGSV
jgi:N-acetyl-1-D-myo-inositol-2-amino-2-deoxy-alpha-D-glucopyranoside deacetylase